MQVNASRHYSLEPSFLQSSTAFYAKSIDQNLIQPFLKVVEGQLIYNFGIDCLWHFSCKILSKTWSKCASSNGFGHHGAPERAPASHIAAPRLGWARTPRPPQSAGPRRGTPLCHTAFLPHSPWATRRALRCHTVPTVPPPVHSRCCRTRSYMPPYPVVHAAVPHAHAGDLTRGPPWPASAA
jgi:hypothetical protein